MKKQKKINGSLAAASCALLGMLNQPAMVQASDVELIKDWEFKAAMLFYSETDRVSAVEPVIQAKKWLDTDESLTFKLVFDSLTGASANGAVPTDFAQTFTRPSGNGSYEIKPGDTPLDDTFRDTRGALSASWEKPLSRMNSLNLSGNISSEYDYLSTSVSALLSHDMNQKNTTLSGGVSFANDSIEPEGQIPLAFAEMTAEGEPKNRDKSSDSKQTTDVLLGLTQVIDKNSLFQLNYSLSMTDGYHTDPFKVLSVVDDADGRPEVLDSGISRVLYEKRPDERQKQSVFVQYKRNFGGDVLDGSYRYLWDDWGLTSNTLDVRYRFSLEKQKYWQAHVRYYQQSAVDFYEPFLLKSAVDAGNLPEYATADYRLGDMNAYTLGLEYGYKSWAFSGELYQQQASEPDGKFGELLNQDLGVDLNAIMFRVNYDF